MAGRYLVIEFDDEESANTLRAQIDAATKKGKKFRVVGLFARPGNSCICMLPGDTRTKDRVKRGGKFGWWVCTNCGKPRLGDHQLVNLVKPEDVIDPLFFKGVDTLTPDVAPRGYFRHPMSLSMVTWPRRVARKNRT